MGKTMFGQLFGVLMVIFIGWIFITGDSAERMERACKPVEWTGNMAVSLVALTYPSGQRRTQMAFENMDYGCQYSLWRLFYETDYLETQSGAGVADDADAETPVAPPVETPETE